MSWQKNPSFVLYLDIKFRYTCVTVEQSRDSTYNREIPLPPLLDEFRKALRDEIEVAKRKSSNSVIPLSNGHKVSQAGAAFQYAFLIDSVLNIPDGAPGDLMIPGKPPLEVSIVSVEGLRLVVSIAVDLGQYVPEARLQSNLIILMRKLIERIELNASSENSAAQRMMGIDSVSGEPKEIADHFSLNANQLKALKSALGRNLTFIWGPPGTGKTWTIGTIAEQLYKENRSVLIVSHTNIAVDQAVKHVAKAIKGKIAHGVLLRLGDPRDEQLNSDFPDVLLKRQVERRSKELVEKKDQLEKEKQELSGQLSLLEHDIAVVEWVSSAEADITSARKQLAILHDKENELSAIEKHLAFLSETRSELLRMKQLADQVIAYQDTLQQQENEIQRLIQQVEELAGHTSTHSVHVIDYAKRTETARQIAPLRKELSGYPPIDKQEKNIAFLTVKLNSLKGNNLSKQKELTKAQAILEETNNTGAMMRLWKRLPKPDEQRATVNRIQREIANIAAAISEQNKRREELLAILNRTTELSNTLLPYSNIGDYVTEEGKFNELTRGLESSKEKLNVATSHLESKKQESQEVRNRLGMLLSKLNGNPHAVIEHISAQMVEMDNLAAQVNALRTDTMLKRRELTSSLTHMIECLAMWGLLTEKPLGAEPMLHLVIAAHSDSAAKYARVNLPDLQQSAASHRKGISDISSRISEIDHMLSQVEKTVIAEASIIGATLTKTYLSDDIQSRKFDTVILDEASMAPIPALWVAALLAEKNIVIVGDFNQLPPIVLSSNELTKKWLGRDIFKVSGLHAKVKDGESPDYFITLTEQLRMVPEITDIANLFYNGQLILTKSPSDNAQRKVEKWQGWYNTSWPHDSPVLLVDTASLNAWVTSVLKNGNTSRLNFLSASVAVDLAEQLLRPDRPERTEGDPNRILIVSPYRAHAKLVSVLLRENKNLKDKKDKDVISGTAHSFQGSEADVVIFDLVVDEPHWRVNLFMPDLDEQLKCLFNVGLTRAKYRLIILGDFEYCLSHAKKAFLGKELLPFLIKKFPKIDALKLVPDGLASRAAKAQITMLGGAIEPDSERLVVTQADFFRILSSDIERAVNRLVIYSAFMTQDRVTFLLPQLQAAANRGVSIYIITKAHSERNADLQQYRKLEAILSEIGAIIIHKRGAHEKLLFIDDDILWVGSLNPLSFSNTQEIMERRKSRSVFEDYSKIQRLEELLAVPNKPEFKCPLCGSEMIAAEGPDEPYYWRCVNDECYTRSINQPYPVDGMLTCARCNSPVEFGYRGDYPYWRCLANKRHMQKVYKSHLRLPKMAALIPKSERKKVCKMLKLDSLEVFSVGNTTKQGETQSLMQSSLFDEES